MPRYDRNQVILAKIESAYGTDSVPTGAANAILSSTPRIVPLQANNVDRDLVRGYLGGSEQLVGTRSVSCEFVVEIAGSGTAGTAPAWGLLLRACGFAEVVTAGTRVDYTPITNDQESLTLYWFDSGVRHVLRGARGNVTIGKTGSVAGVTIQCHHLLVLGDLSGSVLLARRRGSVLRRRARHSRRARAPAVTRCI